MRENPTIFDLQAKLHQTPGQTPFEDDQSSQEWSSRYHLDGSKNRCFAK